MLLPLFIDQPYHELVKRLQGFKLELRPNGAQRRQMRCFAGSCRFVYNKGLALQKTRFDAGEKKLNYAGLCKLLTRWRSDAGIACGFEENADRVGAINVLKGGTRPLRL